MAGEPRPPAVSWTGSAGRAARLDGGSGGGAKARCPALRAPCAGRARAAGAAGPARPTATARAASAELGSTCGISSSERRLAASGTIGARLRGGVRHRRVNFLRCRVHSPPRNRLGVGQRHARLVLMRLLPARSLVRCGSRQASFDRRQFGAARRLGELGAGSSRGLSVAADHRQTPPACGSAVSGTGAAAVASAARAAAASADRQDHRLRLGAGRRGLLGRRTRVRFPPLLASTGAPAPACAERRLPPTRASADATRISAATAPAPPPAARGSWSGVAPRVRRGAARLGRLAPALPGARWSPSRGSTPRRARRARRRNPCRMLSAPPS